MKGGAKGESGDNGGGAQVSRSARPGVAGSGQSTARGDSGATLGAREPSRRVFFALWPDDELRAAFARATHEAVRVAGGRSVPAHNLHATLLFLGPVAERRIPELQAIAARLAGTSRAAAEAAASRTAASTAAALSTAGADAGKRRSPELVFDRIEHWEKPRVLCATVSAPATPTSRPTAGASSGLAIAQALAEALRTEMTGAGFPTDLNLFRAHVTVARKVARPTDSLRMREVRWPVTGFALVESLTRAQGPLYSVINSWALDTRQNN
ncbi:MAG: 2'-5' RNA ligase family protein [Steroidobacteraceae bacterium]